MSSTTNGKFKFAIDRGGTFTDVFAKCPDGKVRVLKLLSEDPQHYKDAPTEGIRRILEEVHKICYPPNKQFDKQTYQKKYELAATLCDKHLAHWNLTQARRQSGAISDTKLTRNFVESLPCRSAVEKAAETWILNQLTSFIISPVQNQIYDDRNVDHLTEMREVTVQFVKIELNPELSPDYLVVAKINKISEIVCGIVSKARGVFLKLYCFDRRVAILAAFGLSAAKLELDSQDSLKSAHQIRKDIPKLGSIQSVSVGVTYGLVYCGVTGHPFRRDYIVIGKPVNKAVQMTSFHPNKLVCDQETYRSSKLCSSYFRLLQSTQQLDETLGLDGQVFEYNEYFEQDCTSAEKVTPNEDQVSLIGRQTEMDLMNLVIQSPEKIGFYHGICFRGSSKIGKTQLLHQGLTKYKKQTAYVAAIDLQMTIQRPYFCASLVYKQLYDIACLNDPQVIEDLPRHVWNWNDILEDKSSLFRKKAITKCFVKLCTNVSADCVLIFIDNVQCIDAKSFEIFDAVLRTSSVRLVCAGNFEQEPYWDMMWRISLSNQVKVVDVEGLDYESQLRHICDCLNVIGISHKLFELIREVCKGRPGWIQTCLERLVDSRQIDVDYSAKDPNYIFRYDICETSSVLVADLSEMFSLRTEQMTLATISLELIDSAKPQVQMAVKTASVLGNIFTRNVLNVLLKFPDALELAGTIKYLFDRGIFECASRYISGCGFQQYTANCLCYGDNQQLDTKNFPRYSFCKLIHFRNKDLKAAVYELLPQDQKIHYHLKITDLLESQDNSCPNCLRNNFGAIINLPTFREVMRCCHSDHIKNQAVEGNRGNSTEIVKDVIRQGIARGCSEETGQTGVQVYVPNQQIWDSTTCFCLEILLNLYVDLIHHSTCAQILEKRVFYMLQYAFVLTKINEMEDAIPVLSEASEFCTIQPSPQALDESFRKVMMAKIHTLLAEVYFKMNNLAAAKNHVAISLRQFNVPMISFKCTLPRTILNHAILLALNSTKSSTSLSNDMIRKDFGMTLRIAGSIFAAEYKWSFATTLSMTSLSLLKSSNCTLDVLCQAYCLAIEMHNFCGKKRVCLALEKKCNRDVSRYTPKNLITDISAVTKLVTVIFQTKTMQGQIANSIRQGFKVLELNMAMQAHQLQIRFVPVLSTLLVQVQRIDEAVCLARILRNIGMKHDVQGFVAYYAFCIELIVDTNFFLEPLEQIDNFAWQYYDTSSKQILNRSDLDDKLLVYLCNYSLKNLKRSSKWSKFHNWDIDRDHCTISSVCNLLKSTECVLIELFHSTNRNKRFELTRAKFYLGKCQEVAEKWRFFMPRYLHYEAYLMQIQYKTRTSFRTLTRALAFARKQGNVLEQSWIKLQSNVWEGGLGFNSNQMNSVHWRQAKTYSPLQWSQIMCPLPI